MQDIITPIATALAPYALDALAAIVAAAITWAANTARQKWGIDIEARHREALQSAIMDWFTRKVLAFDLPPGSSLSLM